MASSYTELCYELLRGITKLSIQNKDVSINWHFLALHSVAISSLSRDTTGQRATLWVPASTHLVVEVWMFLTIPMHFLFLLCYTTVNMCVLVSFIFVINQNIYSGLSEANYYRCLPVCTGGCYWSDLLKNIAMLKNKHKKGRECCLLTLQKEKKAGAGLVSPALPPTGCGGECTQCSFPSFSHMRPRR